MLWGDSEVLLPNVEEKGVHLSVAGRSAALWPAFGVDGVGPSDQAVVEARRPNERQLENSHDYFPFM
jgi:hypothetical protein